MNRRYRLLIHGKNPKYFLALLIRKHISIYSMEEVPQGIIILVDFLGYQQIKDIKTSYQIRVLNRYGFAKIEYLFRKYFIFLLGLVFFFCIIFFLSHLIFKVEVIHSNQDIRTIIYDDLEELGISKFRFKVSYDKKEKIVEKILEKETLPSSKDKIFKKLIPKNRFSKKVMRNSSSKI